MARAVEDQPAGPLTVEALGVRWPHDPGYTVARPYGLGRYLLLRFHSTMVVLTSEGVVSAEPWECLLYDPSFPQWYRGRESVFVDDWLHVYGAGMPKLIQRYGIPVNVIFRPRDTEFITPIFEAINREVRREEPHWRDSVCLLLETLFLQLGRQLIPRGPAGLAPAEEARVEEFRNLRMYVHERMQEPWSVGAISRRANLSRSHFANLYTKILGVSPMEDLIHARLRRACALLTDRGMSVADAAEHSGFGSVCHFSRLFRKHVGCAPRDYHRRPLADDVDISDAPGKRSGPSVWLEHSKVTRGWQLLTGRDLPAHLRAAQERSENQHASTPTAPKGEPSRRRSRQASARHGARGK